MRTIYKNWFNQTINNVTRTNTFIMRKKFMLVWGHAILQGANHKVSTVSLGYEPNNLLHCNIHIGNIKTILNPIKK